MICNLIFYSQCDVFAVIRLTRFIYRTQGINKNRQVTGGKLVISQCWLIMVICRWLKASSRLLGNLRCLPVNL